MNKALILIDDGYEEAELLYPYYRLIEAGYTTDIAGEDAMKTYIGKRGYCMRATHSVLGIDVREYDMVIIPGGNAPDRMRTKEMYVRIVRESLEQEKVIGVICHGAQLLIETDALRGRTITASNSIKKDVINAGARFENSEVVRDDNLVTSRQSADLPAFMQTILQTANLMAAKNDENAAAAKTALAKRAQKNLLHEVST